MSHLWSRALEGELEVDHRASPGLTEDQARRLGYDEAHLALLREGKICRTPTLGCCHCGGVVVINPQRTRGRHFCPKCDQYICDGCHMVSQEPDYVHRPFAQVRDMIQSGKWRFAGGTMSNPVLLPVIGDQHG